MRKFFIISFLALCYTLSSMASVWHNVNVDQATIAAMGAAYYKEGVVESNSRTVLDSILGHYTKATVATTGIFAAKKLEHDSRKDVRLFASEEFFYYKRIYGLVKDGIMPKVINVTCQFVNEPSNILSWGSYLLRTTNNVEDLCKEFECVVTNGRLSFKDLVFLTVNGQFKKYFDLLERFKELSGTDFKSLFEKLGEFGQGLTWDDVKQDMEKFVKNLATVGKGTGDDVWGELSQIGGVFKASPGEIIKMFNDYKRMYNQYKDVKDVKELLLRVVDTKNPNWMSQIFDVSDYNINGYMTSYIKELQGTYRTQMFYIKKKSSGETVLLDYTPKEGMPKDAYNTSGPSKKGVPPTGWEDWLVEGPHDFIGTGDANSVTNCDKGKGAHLVYDTQKISAKTMSVTGWDYSRKSQYESEHPGHTLTYEFTYYHHDYVNYKGHYSNHNHYDTYCFRSAGQVVTDSYTADSIMYSEMYDSQTMDYDAFMEKLERLKKGYEDQMRDKGDTDYGKGYSYVIESDESREYSPADENHIKGIYTVTYLANCKNSTVLADGSFSWKENSKKQGSSLTKESEKLAMMRKGDGRTDEDISSLTQEKSNLEDEIAQLESQEEQLDSKLYELQQKKSQATFNGNTALANQYQAEWESVYRQQQQVKQQKQQKQQRRYEIQSALDEYYSDMMEDSDNDYNRIPKYMDMYSSVYQIEWNDQGSWDESHTYTRLGYSRLGKFPVKFTAKLSLARKPKYFLGIRIHRPILQVEYQLTSDNPSQMVIGTLDLDPKADPAQNAEKVNDRLRELLNDYPDCDITIDYQKSNEVEADDDEDKIHLLFASDRLEIARNVLDKLVDIYGELSVLERLLYTNRTMRSFFDAILNDLTSRSGRRDIATRVFQEWKQASFKAMQRQNQIKRDDGSGNKDDGGSKEATAKES